MRVSRIALWVSIACFATTAGIVGYTLWLATGAHDLIVWEADGGGLELSRQPAKPRSYLRIKDTYSGKQPLDWVKTDRGASERWIGRPKVPPFSELLEKAVLDDSDIFGQIRYYPWASLEQRKSIEWAVEDAAQESSENRARLEMIANSGDAPWLRELLNRLDDRPPDP